MKRLLLFLFLFNSYSIYAQRVIHSTDTIQISLYKYLVTDSLKFYGKDNYTGDSSLISVLVKDKYYNNKGQILIEKRTEEIGNNSIIYYTKYYENGNIKEKYSVSQMRRKVGYYLSCYENGKINTIGYYRQGLPVNGILVHEYAEIEFGEDPDIVGDFVEVYYYQGEKIGTWRYYQENGFLLKEEMYPEEDFKKDK